MPFDGRLLDTDPAPHDENGEIIFPPELQELAGQLTSEANNLEKQHPFDRELTDRDLTERPAVAAGSTPKRWLGLISGTVGALLAVTACSLLVAFFGSSPELKPTLKPSPAPNATTSVLNNGHLNSNTTQASTHNAPLHITPAMAFPDVSSPELEGILDVLESSADRTCSISL